MFSGKKQMIVISQYILDQARLIEAIIYIQADRLIWMNQD